MVQMTADLAGLAMACVCTHAYFIKQEFLLSEPEAVWLPPTMEDSRWVQGAALCFSSLSDPPVCHIYEPDMLGNLLIGLKRRPDIEEVHRQQSRLFIALPQRINF